MGTGRKKVRCRDNLKLIYEHGLCNKPKILKVALIASAYRNAGSSMSYVRGSIGLDCEEQEK